MIVSLIAAVAENRVIGKDNHLPWKLPADMKWFRDKTMGKPVLMGRKTFESFGAKPLPGRQNIIITRQEDYRAEGAQVVHSIDEATHIAKAADEIMIIGGASFYEEMLPRADRFYLTLVHHKFEGDTLFPPFDMNDWKEVFREEHPPDEKNPYAYSFIVLEK